MTDKTDMKKAFRNAGTASDLIMKRSVLRNVRKHPEGVLFGAMPGADAAWLSISGETLVLRSSGFASSELPEEVGRMAFLRAAANMAAEGGRIKDVQIYIQAGRRTPEDKLRAEMHFLTEYTKSENISISGGNTTYLHDTKDYSILVSAVGVPEKCTMEQGQAFHKKIVPQDKILYFGNVGDYGAAVLAASKREELKKRFSDSYIDEICLGEQKIDIRETAYKLLNTGCVKKLHDVSFGGIYEALYQLSNYAGLGVSVMHEGLTIRQETIELCEFFGINPYMLLGTGGILAVVGPENEEKVCEAIGCGSLAGYFTKEGERRVSSDSFLMNRILTPVEHDEIYHVLL